MSNPSPISTREWAEMHCESLEHCNSQPEVLCPVCLEALTDPEEVSKCHICKLHAHAVCGDAILIGPFYEFVCDNCNPFAKEALEDANESKS